MNAQAPRQVQDVELRALIDAIYLQYHYDFRSYAFVSIKRRIGAALARFGFDTVSELQGKVLRDATLFGALLDYLTVQVSDMFRDPEYFRVLRERVAPVLHTYPSLKVWVAGCSSGEEAYSFAILLRECGLLSRTLIYATDINARALEQARSGVYAIDRLAGFTENHRRSGGTAAFSDYYTAAYGNAVFDRSLRDHIVFADHSLATDSVFAEMQLVSCRNVLIYFDRGLQDRAVRLFRDALCLKGFLGIGARESLRFTSYAAAFEPVSQEHRVFQKVGA
ncbi:CheR family methyltransferase [Chiayiivirga flava]|uniref:Chemotaxis protein methyltransferase CheR n=1 Tax=Chiayiivirga flava TaxID=659595 RepID=A0A7W8D243_9GAMM|nr:CheR family methyltransferase [Chiayiivirga flava]MBB5206501.1 chemotaxis protein methyltransferase CheR [Chiayiivirga flava]